MWGRWAVLECLSQPALFFIFILFYYFFFGDRISLCSFGRSGTRFVDQTGLKPKEIHLPMPL